MASNSICCKYTLELPYRGHSIAYLQHVTKNKEENYFGNLHFPSIMSSVFTSFKHPNHYQNSCHSTANCSYLHDSYLSKFEFIYYLFANPLVVWLYRIYALRHIFIVQVQLFSNVRHLVYGLVVHLRSC